jgi:hypothetical protein
MTMHELMAEQQMEQIRHLDAAWIAYEAEARAAEHRPGVRERLATVLVKVGGWLDRGAVERAAGTAKVTPPLAPASRPDRLWSL